PSKLSYIESFSGQDHRLMPTRSRLSFTVRPTLFHAEIPVSLETRSVSAEKDIEETLAYMAGLADESCRIARLHPKREVSPIVIGKLTQGKLRDCTMCLSSVHEVEEIKGCTIAQQSHDR